MNELDPQAVKASRKRFVALLAVAFVPIFIAYGLYFYIPDLAPSGSTNQGELINPPVDGATVSPELAELETWVLIQPIHGDCDDRCEQLLYLSRQVIAGLNKDASRVARVVLTSGPLPEGIQAVLQSEHSDIQVIETGEATDWNALESPFLLLRDPNNNIMMMFPFSKAGKPMLRDLKHLLRISNIG